MANTFKFGNGNWAVKEDLALAYNDQNGNFKPLPFDFTRGSSATRVNKQGLIQTIPSGKPRIDFFNNTNGHLLLEPLRRNLATDSNLSLLSGGSSGSITTTGDGSSTNVTLSNGLTGKRLTVNSSGRAYLNISCTVVSGTEYTISIYTENYSGADQSNFIDILSGGGGEDFSSSLIENDRIQGTFTATSTTVVIRIGNGTTSTRTGSYSVDISGVQLEDSGSGSDATFATSLIQTSGSIVTRSAEEANGAGNSTVFNDSEGVLYAEIAALANDGGSRRLGISDSSTSDRVILGFTSSDNQIQGFTTDTTTQANMTHTVSDATSFNKIAIKYKADDFALWINGTEVDTDTGTTPSGLIEAAFDDGGGVSDFYGKIKDLRVYDTALSDSELQALTS